MPKIGFDTDIYSNDGTTWYGGDDMLDMGFTITVQSNKLVGQFQASRNGATLDNGDLILPFNILGLTQTINKQTPDDGMAVGDSITTYNGQMSGSVALYVVPAPESDITPKAVSLDNLQTFKGKCDETYAPMSRALPAPAGTTDAGKVPTVNSAGNGYTLQTPSGGGKQLYKHSFDCSVGTSGYFCRLDVVSVVSTAMTDDEFITELKSGRIISSFLYMSFDAGGPGGIAEWFVQCILNYYGSNLYASYAQQSTFSTDEVVINSTQSTVVAL